MDEKKGLLFAIEKLGKASIVVILAGIIRTKISAIYLGVSGIGILAAYNNLATNLSHVSTIGIQMSGVKYLSSKRDDRFEDIKRIYILKRLTLILYIPVLISAVLFGDQIGNYFLNDKNYKNEIIIVVISILFTNLYSINSAILQAKEKINELAKLKIKTSVSGLMIATLIYLNYGEVGIPYVILLISMVSLLFSSMVVKYDKGDGVNFRDVYIHGRELIKDGLGFIVASLSTAVTLAYIINLAHVHLDQEQIGLYAAALGIMTISSQFIFSAMGSDYYPKLCKATNNHIESNKLINSQLYLSITLAIPLFLCLSAFSEKIVTILYSENFVESGEILRILLYGLMIKSIAWPFGYVLVSKSKIGLWISLEVLYFVIQLLLINEFIPTYGIKSAAIIISIVPILNMIIVVWLTKRWLGFKLEKNNIYMLSFFIISIITAHLLKNIYLNGIVSYEMIFSLLIGAYGAIKLNKIRSGTNV